MKVLWILVVLIFGAAAVGLAVQRGVVALPFNRPNISIAEGADITASLSSIDQSLAAQIRSWREEGWRPPEILGAVTGGIEQAGQSTVSASVTATPDEVWQSFREQGAQAALGQVVESAEVSVNSVSQNVLNEARYQYCLGVVESHQSR